MHSRNVRESNNKKHADESKLAAYQAEKEAEEKKQRQIYRILYKENTVCQKIKRRHHKTLLLSSGKKKINLKIIT